MRARANRSAAMPAIEVDPTLDLTRDELHQGLESNREWHWYDDNDGYAQRVVDWDDPDLPRMLIECGRLVRLHIRTPKTQENPRHPRRDRDTRIEFSRTTSNNSFIAFDPNHPDERLYMLVDPPAARTLKKRFWDQNTFPELRLNEVALTAGGRHGKRADYPDVTVKPLGILTAVVYYTDKKNDGPSYYIHKMAEVSGSFPFLCIDRRGRLWLAGGAYRSPTAGISD